MFESEPLSVSIVILFNNFVKMKYAVTILLLAIGAACISAQSNGQTIFGDPKKFEWLLSNQVVETPFSKTQTVSYVGVSTKSIIVFDHVIL